MKESIALMYDDDNRIHSQPKNERKKRGKLSETLTPKSFFLEELKDPKNKKIRNKFIFKVYLHLFFQIILILSLVLFAFINKKFNSFLTNNKIVFYVNIITAFILFIYPLYSDQILTKFPFNYIYLLIFTISISYIICKISIVFSPTLVKIGAILLICEILYLLIDSFMIKKKYIDFFNTSAFLGLCLLFVSSILYYIEKINVFKIILIFLIVLLFGIYLIYDMNLIFSDIRRNFGVNDYVLANMFLYIDIIQTIFELIIKYYNSFEPERMPINKAPKSMIYVGDEEYENLYNQKEEEKKKKEDDLLNSKRRTHSVKAFSIDPNKIIKETEKENEEDEKDNENDNDISFKNSNQRKLVFDNIEEEEENEK